MLCLRYSSALSSTRCSGDRLRSKCLLECWSWEDSDLLEDCWEFSCSYSSDWKVTSLAARSSNRTSIFCISGLIATARFTCDSLHTKSDRLSFLFASKMRDIVFNPTLMKCGLHSNRFLIILMPISEELTLQSKKIPLRTPRR